MKKILAVLLALALLCTFAPFAAAEKAPAEPAAEAAEAPVQAEQPADGLLEQLQLRKAARRESPVGDPEVILSGECGTGVTWQLDDEFTLTVGGSGEIQTYSAYTAVPWYTLSGMIRKIVVEDGIRVIPSGTFRSCTAVEEIVLPFVGYTKQTAIADSQYAVFGYIFGYDSTEKAWLGGSDATIASMRNRTEYQNAANKGTVQYAVKYSNDYHSLYYYYIPTSLRSVTITGDTYIPTNAFANCDFLTEIRLPESVTEIGSYAFYNCDGLTGFVLPDGVRTLNGNAFLDCANLQQIDSGTQLQTIGAKAFADCAQLEQITLPATVSTIHSDAFSGCTDLQDVHISDLAAWLQIAFGSEAANPLYVGAGKLYLNGELLTELTVPDGTTAIKMYAFDGASAIRKIVVPDSVTSIGVRAFRGCTALEEIVLPFVGQTKQTAIAASATAVFGYIFGYDSTEKAWLGGSDATIASMRTFTDYKNAANKGTVQYAVKLSDNYHSLRYYYIPTSLRSVTITGDTYIPTNAFANCDFLTEIRLPESVTEIGSYALYNCDGLTSLELYPNLTKLNANAVLDCANLTDVYYHGTRSEYLAINGVDQFNDMTPHFTASGTCGENVTWEIDFDGTLILDGEGAATGMGYLGYYDSIQAVAIRSGVTSITNTRFTALANNASFTVDEANESLKSVDGMVLSKDGKTLIAVPVTMTGTLTVPGSVETIAASAAQNTKIGEVVLPKRLKAIESNAFANTTLSSVTFGGSEDGWSMVTVASGNDQIHDVVCLLPNDPHVWDDGVVTTQPTCTEAGVRTFRCADCELTKTEEVPALGHDWSAEKQVITEATMTETGLRGYVCSRCHATKDEEVIPKVIENLSGDLNHDGAINMKDLLLFRQFLAGGYGVTLG
ncbi:MAG: leucine-rich repeat protein [Oscillospiraceae bacterium]|nr:leucine-rich repeat protein [Oscillospiraceae bacterium]